MNSQLAAFPNREGKLPLTLAIEHGHILNDSVSKIMLRAAPESTMTRDIQSHMYPFMKAALMATCADKVGGSQYSSRNIRLKQFERVYDLLLNAPTLLALGVSEMRSKRKFVHILTTGQQEF